MAIEGPLRELGIHDVFQLLDLSRKTGTLAVRSELRHNEGTVLFDSGRVVAATIKSNPHRMGDLLVQSGRVTEADITKARDMQIARGDNRRLGEVLVELGLINSRELERQVRLQIEAVVFELLSWGEGYFRFEEGSVSDAGLTRIHISIEALLMEGARRIDEWSRISDRVPSLSAVPVLAPADAEDAPRLDLLPNEWEVLSMIDGGQDLKSIAALLARSEFDVAKVVYGLITTGVVELRMPPGVTTRRPRVPTPAVVERVTPVGPRTADRAAERVDVAVATPEPADDLERGFAMVGRGDYAGAVAAWTQFLRAYPNHDWSERVRGGLDAARRLHTLQEARRSD